MRILFIIFALFIHLYSSAQNSNKEINEQVWKPFIRSFDQNDIHLFKSIHLPELIRVQTNEMLNYETYMKGYTSMFEQMKQKNSHYAIDLRFTRRVADSTRAFEEGYYKTTVMQNGTERTGYGKFSVVLLKKEGRWKILLDSDTNAGANEAVFMEAKPIE
jgi:hypothetical protein